MVNQSNVWYLTFQQKLLEKEHKKILHYLQNNDLGITKEKYLEICKVTSTEPDPEKTPIDFSDLLEDTQLAMAIVLKLPDLWSMEGSSLGKDLTLLPYLFELYEINNKLDMLDLVNLTIDESTRLANNKIRQQVKHGKK